jgi:hypothetical protein
VADSLINLPGAAPPAPPPARPCFILAVAAACSVAIAVLHAVFAVHAGPLWRDEVSDVNFAAMASWKEIWSNLHLDNFPPLLLFVLRAWAAAGLGATDAGFRFWGFLAGMALLAILWTVSRLTGLRAPLWGLVLFGLSPYAFWFGDAVRPYGLGAGFVLLTFGLVWRLIRTGSIVTFGLAAAAAVLSVQTLYQSSVLILSVGIAGATACVRSREKTRTFLVLGVGGAAAVSLLPYLPIIQQAGEWNFISRSGVSWEGLFAMLTQALSAAGVLSLILWAGLTGVALFIAAAQNIPRTKISRGTVNADLSLYAALTIVLSICFFLGLLKFLGFPTQPWYFLALIALTAAALDAVLCSFFRSSRPGIQRTLGTIAAVTALMSLPSVWEKVNIRQTKIDLVAARLEKTAEEKDLIIVNPWFYGITFQRYFHKPAEWQTIPPMTDHRIHRYDLLKQQMAADDPLKPLTARITETLSSGHRVWVVGTLKMPSGNRPPPVFPPAPRGPAGWSEDAYQFSWSMQVAHLLATHAARAQVIDIPLPQAVNPFENAILLEFDGWRQAPP